MKIKYMKETDSLFIIFSGKLSADSVEIDDGIIADVDDSGNLVGLEFYSVKDRFRQSFETVSESFGIAPENALMAGPTLIHEPPASYRDDDRPISGQG